MLDAKLIVVGGDAKASEIRLRLPTIIGRGREASLTLPHPLVSRLHTEIFERDGKLYVRDLGSLNGTFINNRRISEEEVLEPDELLTLGNVTFRACYKVAGQTGTNEVLKAASKVQSIEMKTLANSPAARVPVSTQPADDTTPRDVGKAVRSPDRESHGPLETTMPAASVSQPAASSNGKVAGDQKLADIVSIHDPELPSAEKSISASSLESLPAARSTLDIAGEIVASGEQRAAAVSDLDPASLEIDGEDRREAADPDNSSLGSFLKKLPR